MASTGFWGTFVVLNVLTFSMADVRLREKGGVVFGWICAGVHKFVGLLQMQQAALKENEEPGKLHGKAGT